MAAVLCSPRIAHVPVFAETPGMDEGYDAVNVARCRDLLAGRPLPDLPESALSMPGSRSRSAPAREPGDEEEDDGTRRTPRNAGESRRPPHEATALRVTSGDGRERPAQEGRTGRTTRAQ
jgi:hypothetical protein